jgi:hypothetical protein
MAFEATAADRTPPHGQDAVGTAHKDPLPRRAPVRLDKQIDKQSFNRLRV